MELNARSAMTVGHFLSEFTERRESAASLLAELCLRVASRKARRLDLDPEELSQDALLRIFAHDAGRLRSLDPDASLEGVVQGFIHNLAGNQIASRLRRRRAIARVTTERSENSGLMDPESPTLSERPHESPLGLVREALLLAGWEVATSLPDPAEGGSISEVQLVRLLLEGRSLHGISKATGLDRKSLRERFRRWVHAPPTPPDGKTGAALQERKARENLKKMSPPPLGSETNEVKGTES